MGKPYNNRKAAHILNDKHKIITAYARKERMSIKNAVDEIIETGLRVRRLLPVPSSQASSEDESKNASKQKTDRSTP